MSKVSEVTGIPETTLATWKNKSDWWDGLVVQVSSEIGEQILIQNLTNAMKSGDELADRIENGDQKLVKIKRAIKHDNGDMEVSEDYELRREPMKGRDLVITTGIVQDKARVQMNLPTAIAGKPADYQALAQQFKELSEKWDEKQVCVVSVQSEEESN